MNLQLVEGGRERDELQRRRSTLTRARGFRGQLVNERFFQILFNNGTAEQIVRFHVCRCHSPPRVERRLTELVRLDSPTRQEGARPGPGRAATWSHGAPSRVAAPPAPRRVNTGGMQHQWPLWPSRERPEKPPLAPSPYTALSTEVSDSPRQRLLLDH